MHLKRLEIQGFKSFADKVTLEFNSGITSIVGPNGSGKSNIADSIRWVLGEQKTSNLRGNKMEDIIFSGTEHRRTMGFAEVSLTIDNNERILPIEYSEVTITRRLFRSGESEYYINKTLCRLKDIRELFVDTGIGKEGYSIIGQSRVDDILSNKSEDRRFIFEEASGIMKYKLRKQEAEKKLENTKQNILRINDIIYELENQLQPLKSQADKARKYLDLRQELKVFEVNVFLKKIERLKKRIDEIDKNIKSIKSNIDNEKEEIEKLNRKARNKNILFKSRGETLDESRQQYYRLEKNLEKYDSEIKLNKEKLNNLSYNNERLNNEIKELKIRIERFAEDKKQRNNKLQQMHQRYVKIKNMLSFYEEKMLSVRNTLDENEVYIEELKNDIMEKMDSINDIKMQVNNLENHINSISDRSKNIEVEKLDIDNNMNSEKKEKNETLKISKELENEINNSKKRIKVFQTKKDNLNKQLSNLRQVQTKIKSDKQFKTSRYKMLKEMENNFEGYKRSVKTILKSFKDEDSIENGIHGALAQLINVKEKYETAIEMTLGGILQNIVTSSDEDAKKAIDFLKRKKLGRATFLPVSSVKGYNIDNKNLTKLKMYKGFCGVASDLIEYNSIYEGIILSFLGRVVVVDNINTGIRMAKDFKYSFRIVTLEGDIVSTRGSITGGGTGNKVMGILGRSRELSKTYEDILSLTKKEMKIEQDIDNCIKEIEKFDPRIFNETEKIRNMEIKKGRSDDRIIQINENIKRMKSKTEIINNEKEQLQYRFHNIKKEKNNYIIQKETIEKKIEEIRDIIASCSKKHQEDKTAKDRLQEDINKHKISKGTISESMEGIKKELINLDNEKTLIKENIDKKHNEKVKNNKIISEISKKNESLNKMIKKSTEEKTGKTLEIDKIEEERKILENDLKDIENKTNNINNNIMLLKEECGRLEVRKAKTESELNTIQNRMWDEYELTYNNALSLRKDIGSISKAQDIIDNCRATIKELGVVNVGAIDDYVKTKERYEFMTTQRDDMEQAREKLYQVINKMTKLMKQQFMERFKLINNNFNEVFTKLFDGGKAELVLVDQKNVLESGIDIKVQPPGKKLQNMLLLSGGERAFTAIALLFAILKLKPVPFCVLDEIEAALDDSNVYKFATYLSEFTKDTQFIMVTHRKGTMEYSDALYGVTMQEHGISDIVSIKLGEKVS